MSSVDAAITLRYADSVEEIDAVKPLDLAITTAKTNVDAHRFYERRGFSQAFVVYHGRRDRP